MRTRKTQIRERYSDCSGLTDMRCPSIVKTCNHDQRAMSSRIFLATEPPSHCFDVPLFQWAVIWIARGFDEPPFRLTSALLSRGSRIDRGGLGDVNASASMPVGRSPRVLQNFLSSNKFYAGFHRMERAGRAGPTRAAQRANTAGARARLQCSVDAAWMGC